MTTVDVLTCARALVAAGWTQRTFVRDDGGVITYCAMGALSRALREADGEIRRLLWEGAWQSLIDALPKVHLDVVAWNDRPGRTQEEVLALFDRAIAYLQEGSK